MKTADYLKSLRVKNQTELKAEVLSLSKEQFNLRMQKATGQQAKNHLIHEVRKNIARVKTIQRAKAQG